jgi:uncharacterized protein YjcR
MSHKIEIYKKDLIKLFIQKNLSAREIAIKYHCSAVTILNWLRRFNLTKFIKIGFKKGRKNPKVSGNLSPTKRPEVKQKMSNNHYDCIGDKNPNFGNGYKIEGDKNPNWLGGISNNGYSWKFNNSLKEQIRNRDNHTCQNCSMTEKEHLIKYNELLHVHHIDYNKMNCQENNLITLCLKCNILANYNRNEWQYKFEGVLNGKQ